jgi:F0F1-type ATP synthase assembly protein I
MFNKKVHQYLLLHITCGLLLIVLIYLFTNNTNITLSSLSGFFIVSAVKYIHSLYVCKNKMLQPNEVMKNYTHATFIKFIINLILIAFFLYLYKNCNILVFIISYIFAVILTPILIFFVKI